MPILRNVGGIPGLHVLLDAFSRDVERQLFESAVHGGDEPKIDQRHGTHTNPTMWAAGAPEILQVCNVVKDSKLVPDYVTPNYLFAITYPAGCTGFKDHFDSRYRWGETVVGVTMGRGCTMYFVPGNKQIQSAGAPAYDPPSSTSSSTSLGVRVKNYESGYFAIEVSLPRRSIYVMSGAARVDWKHGIRALPKALSPGEPPPPPWNPHNMRRALTLRATKAYSDIVLAELEAANPHDASIQARRAAQSKYRPEKGHYQQDSGGKLSDVELSELYASMNELYRSHQALPLGLRFEQRDLPSFTLPPSAMREDADARRIVAMMRHSHAPALGPQQHHAVPQRDDAAARLEEAQLAAAIAASLHQEDGVGPPRHNRAAPQGVAEPWAEPTSAHGAAPGPLASLLSVLESAREHWWPYPQGAGHLGVQRSQSVHENIAELRRRIEVSKEFTAAQALHRMTDGMPNHDGPPNGPSSRPTLATKWKAGSAGHSKAAGVDAHVQELKRWLSERAHAEIARRTSAHRLATPSPRGPASAGSGGAGGGSGGGGGGASRFDPISLDESDDDERKEASGREVEGAVSEPDCKKPRTEAEESSREAREDHHDEVASNPTADEKERMRLARLRRFGA